MITVKPQVELLFVTPDAAKLIEAAGRTCYKSEDRITEDSAKRFVHMLKNVKKHMSVIEHASATLRFICDRGVTHEMVRHRIAAFSQESTRYCNYGKCKFGGQISVIEPPFAHPESKEVWRGIMEEVETVYLAMLGRGEKPEIARSILPNCLKTEIVMTCNFREWLHVFDLRTCPQAHPQIREVMIIAQNLLHEACPEVFDAYTEEE